MVSKSVMLACLYVMMSLTASSADELKLEQAVQCALTNNPSIKSGQFSAEAARQAVRGAGALVNPEVSVAPSIVGTAGADSAVLFSQPLELNGSRKVRREIAVYQSTAAGFDAATTRRDVVLRVRQTYWDIARAEELVRLNQDNVTYFETLRAAVQKQFDVGAVPGSQVLKTNVELARAKQDLTQAQLDLAQAKASMNALLNRPKDMDFALADPLAFCDIVIERTQLQSAAQIQRPEVASAAAQTQVAQWQIRAVQLRRVPDLAVQARLEKFSSDSDGGVALAVTLPLLDWGSISADRRRAEYAARSQQMQLEARKNSVSLDVEQAVQQLQTTAQIVRDYQSGILSESEELSQMARLGYEKGATSYLEVLEAQRTLRSTKAAYYSALANHAKAIAQLEWATGCEMPARTLPESKK